MYLSPRTGNLQTKSGRRKNIINSFAIDYFDYLCGDKNSWFHESGNSGKAKTVDFMNPEIPERRKQLIS
jgi:hypothetical protein